MIKPKSRSTKHWQRADANYFIVDGVSANFGVTAYIALVQTAGGALPPRHWFALWGRFVDRIFLVE